MPPGRDVSLGLAANCQILTGTSAITVGVTFSVYRAPGQTKASPATTLAGRQTARRSISVNSATGVGKNCIIAIIPAAGGVGEIATVSNVSGTTLTVSVLTNGYSTSDLVFLLEQTPTGGTLRRHRRPAPGPRARSTARACTRPRAGSGSAGSKTATPLTRRRSSHLRHEFIMRGRRLAAKAPRRRADRPDVDLRGQSRRVLPAHPGERYPQRHRHAPGTRPDDRRSWSNATMPGLLCSGNGAGAAAIIPTPYQYPLPATIAVAGRLGQANFSATTAFGTLQTNSTSPTELVDRCDRRQRHIQ